jgi:hypothetical protein
VFSGRHAVKALLTDVEQGSIGSAPRPGAQKIYPLLKARGIRVLGYPDWLKINAAENAAKPAANRGRNSL